MNTDLSLLSLFDQASVLVKFIMFILLALSIASWTIIIQRTLILRQNRKELKAFEAHFQSGYDLNQMYNYLKSKRHTLAGVEHILGEGFKEFTKLYREEALPQAVMENTERAMRVALSREEQGLEAQMPFLATVASISVYIGLFGTVWGIMTAFQALGNVQHATLAMVAPGISEALVATALGLFAAIPAAFAYHRLQTILQNLLRSYENLAEEFSGALYRKLFAQTSSTPDVKNTDPLSQ